MHLPFDYRSVIICVHVSTSFKISVSTTGPVKERPKRCGLAIYVDLACFQTDVFAHPLESAEVKPWGPHGTGAFSVVGKFPATLDERVIALGHGEKRHQLRKCGRSEVAKDEPFSRLEGVDGIGDALECTRG